jgi:hypothetical protein
MGIGCHVVSAATSACGCSAAKYRLCVKGADAPELDTLEERVLYFVCALALTSTMRCALTPVSRRQGV